MKPVPSRIGALSRPFLRSSVLDAAADLGVSADIAIPRDADSVGLAKSLDRNERGARTLPRANRSGADKAVMHLITVTLIFATELMGQVTTGALAGYLIDPTERPVANAPMLIQNQDQSFQRSARSDAVGFYQFVELPPGSYVVSVHVTGFEVVSTPLKIMVDDRGRLDIRLPLAGRTDRVVVRSSVSDLRTESGELGLVLSESRIDQLPLNQRDFLRLALLAPGVLPPVEDSELSTRGSFAMHANGAREEFNNFLLDGVDNNDSDNNRYVLQPSVDTIQEFKIATNSYSAEYGKAGGAQVNVITRSGSNRLKGTAYEYLRNRKLDARNYFDGPEPTKYIRNQFGGGAGGPIVRDKTFFYGTFDGLRERQELSRLGTVPDAASRQGNLSSSVPVIDPFSGTPFPGNIIPASRISPLATKVLALYPLPNRPGSGGNYLGEPVLRGEQNQTSGRVDHRISEGGALTFRYSYMRRNLFEPYAEQSTNLPGFGDYLYDRGHNAMVHYQQTFRPRVVNSLILGLNRAVRQLFPQNHDVDVNKLWGVNYLPTLPRDFGYPGIVVGDYSRVGDVSSLPIDRAATTYQITDNLAVIRGEHALRMGGEIRELQMNGVIEVFTRGQMSFTGGLTQSSLGDLLLGLPTFGILSHYTTPQTMRSQSYGGYFQDDWKVHHNLTLNLGIRYEYHTPTTDPTNRLEAFNLGTGKLSQVGTQGVTRSGYRPDRNNFAPRIGVAWSLSQHTVVRGGYGLYYDSGMFVANSSLYFNPPYFTIQVFFPSATSPLTLADPFSVTGGFTPPASLSSISPDLTTAYVQHWNVNVERVVTGLGTLSLAYAGSKGTHLIRSRDINQPLPGSGDVGDRAPYPAFSNILLSESGSNSEFHSLQLFLTRPLTRSLSLLAAYTFCKSIDDTSAFLPTSSDQNFPQNSRAFRLERGLSSYDMPHRASIAYVYQLPRKMGWMRGIETSGILTAQSGQAMTPRLQFDNSNTGNTGGNFGVDRPNVVHKPSLANPGPDKWFDTGAFAIPPQYTFGNAGRNILRGPGLATLDMAVRRPFAFGENKRLIAEAQAFNLLNRTNFDNPQLYVDQANTFGRIFSAKAPRQVQLALRLQF